VKHEDILAYIVVETLRQGGLPESLIEPTAARILPGFRATFGGDRYYIPRQAPTLSGEDERRQSIVRDAMSSMPTQAIEKRHGVSRRTIYRLLKRHARKD
jgi:Mor family transcriptional regulator